MRKRRGAAAICHRADMKARFFVAIEAESAGYCRHGAARAPVGESAPQRAICAEKWAMTRNIRWRRLGVLCSLALAGAPGAAPAQEPAQAPAEIIEGVWLTDSQSEMTIARCLEGFCGYISKIVITEEIVAKYGNDVKAIGTNFTDYNNKDPALRSRPIQGLQILTLRASNSPFVYEGEIYNPEDGNVYAGAVEVTGADSITLKGCVLYVLCQEQQWTRVPQIVGE